MPSKEQVLASLTNVISYIGEDPTRDGLLETPKRVLASYDELFSGYKQNPADHMKTFKDNCDEMVVLKDVEFFSTCEHHMLPFFGVAHIAYIPKGNVIGISKLARILEVFSRRMQIQERICQQVTQCLNDYLDPRGSACILEAKHFCMTCRGVSKQSSTMLTSSLTGAFKLPEVRQELLALIT